MRASLDDINRKTMDASVTAYAVVENTWKDALFPAEEGALALVAEEARGQPILDLGVGAGRTVKALRAISRLYTGLDYTAGMIEACRRKYPDAEFVQGDARDLSRFADGCFFLVFFSCTGIGMVDHQGRMAILREVYRVLRPGGAFVFSTGNRDREGHNRRFRFPAMEPARNPVLLLKSAVGFLRDTASGLVNRFRLRRLERECEDYCIVNDTYHNYATLIYYITEKQQQAQLESVGFLGGSAVFDRTGRVFSVSRDNDITLVARKPG